jgi:hypothetical protein
MKIRASGRLALVKILPVIGAFTLASLLVACPGTPPGGGVTNPPPDGTTSCPAPLCVDRGGTADAVDVAIDGAGRAVVAYTKDTQGSESFSTLYVRRLEAGAWNPLGAAIFGQPTINFGAALTVDGTDRPVLAHAVNDGSTLKIEVRRYNGTTWEVIGGLVNRAIVAGLEWDGSKYLLTTKTLVGDGALFSLSTAAGATWTLVSDAAPGVVRRAGLNGSAPFVLSKQPDAPNATTLSAWNGSAWTGVGSSVGVSSSAQSALGFAVCGTQATVLVSTQNGSDYGFTARRSSALGAGATWSDLGAINAAGTKTGATGDVECAGSSPVVAYFEAAASLVDTDTLRFKRFTGSAWSEVGTGFKDAQLTALASGVRTAARGSTVGAIWDSPGGNPGFAILYRGVTVP